MPQDPARSKSLSMHGNTLHGNREIPCLPEAKRMAGGRIGKSKDSANDERTGEVGQPDSTGEAVE